MDNHKLAFYGEIFEKTFYGDISDDELIRGEMDLLLKIYTTTATQKNIDNPQTLPETMKTTFKTQSNQMNQSYNDESDKYF